MSKSRFGKLGIQLTILGLGSALLMFASGVSATAPSTTIGSTGISTGGDLSVTGNSSLGTVTAGTWNGSVIGISYGGTGATSDVLARAALGLAIGTDIEAYDATLDAWKAVATSAKAASGANSDITSLTGLTTALSVGQGGTGATSAANARTALGLAIGTNVQAYSANLAAWAGVASSDYTNTADLTSLLSGKQAASANLSAWSALATSVKQNASANLTEWSGVATADKAASGANSDITSLSALTSLSVGGHVVSTGIAPTVGTSTCASVSVAASDTDTRGSVTATCTAGQTAVVHFHAAYASNPFCLISSTNAPSRTGQAYVSANTTDMTVTASTDTVTAATWNYICIQ